MITWCRVSGAAQEAIKNIAARSAIVSGWIGLSDGDAKKNAASPRKNLSASRLLPIIALGDRDRSSKLILRT
jgi:hypothetical protein